MKILIVEDESLVAFEIASALKRENYTITARVSNAEDAFTSIKEDMPDLVIMDINIDGELNGIKAAEDIIYEHRLPVIFLTAYTDNATIDEAIASAPAAYLIKPFKRQELYAAVSLALSKRIKTSSTPVQLSDECTYIANFSELQKGSTTLSLTKKEKQLLDLLLEYKNELIPFTTIENELWPDKAIEVTTRRTLIHRLRGKIGENSIETKKDQGCILKL